MPRVSSRRLVPVATALLALFVLGSIADAHDPWLVPETFAAAERDTAVSSVGRGAPANPDSAAVVDAVARYHAALAGGDSATALQLLASDAVILESGGAESRDEYRAHHLPADIAFAAAVRAQRTVTRVVVRGDMAWVASTSTSQGAFRGRTINSVGAELMVLSRTTDGWRISAIHWSSRVRRQ